MEYDTNELARSLGRLAFDLQGRSDTESTLELISHGAVRLVPGVRWAGISQVSGRRVVPRAATDAVVEKLDAVQAELDEGPCLTALREHRTVLVDDTASDVHWPRFSTAASNLGVGSVLSLQLFVRSENLGALNLFAADARVYGHESQAIGGVHATVSPGRTPSRC